MSKINSNTIQTSQRLEVIELSNSLSLEIPNDILDKIQFLCRSISKVEWSGILFYTIEGSVRDVANAKLICKDILLMDKGSSAYTEYDWDEEVVEYRMDNPDSIDWLVGHVHSHNVMSVFFSGTDMSELNDNCPNHNIYLSLIVNNFMEMTAKVAFSASPTQFTCKDEEGKDYSLKLTDYAASTLMCIYNCTIIKEERSTPISEAFTNRLKYIEEKASKKMETKIHTPGYTGPVKTYGKQQHNKGFSGKGLFEGSENEYWNQKHREENSFTTAKDVTRFLDAEERTKEVTLTTDQQFTAFMLRLGNLLDEDSIEDALEDLEIGSLSPEGLSDSILQSYPAYYDQFFDGRREFEGDKAFLDMLEKVLFNLEEEENAKAKDEYDFLPLVIEKLKALGHKFEEQSKLEA